MIEITRINHVIRVSRTSKKKKVRFFKQTILNALLIVISLSLHAKNNTNINSKNSANDGSQNFQIIPGICSGLNFDVENIGNKFCLISDMYYELDSTGTVLSSDPTVIDTGQDGYDFCPSIAISKDSTVHVISRVGGNKGDGFNLMYSKKQFGQEWLVKNKQVGYPVPRNYVIDIAPSGDSAIYAHAEEVQDVKSIIHFYSLSNERCDSIGALPSRDRLRSDADFRMKIYNDSLFLVSGFPYPNERVFFMQAKISANLPEKLEESHQEYRAGTGRRGQPDIAVDQNGRVHFTFGAQYEVYYSSIHQQNEIITNKILMANLGEWHLNLGLSAIAVSDDGNTIMVVGLKTNNTKTATHCDILWTLSQDGGMTWTYPQNMDVDTYGAEGRLRPTLLYSNGKFYLFYYDNDVDSISMAILNAEENEFEQSGMPVISPSETNHQTFVNVNITNETEAKVFYTTDGTDPDINSTEYTAPISLYQTTTVKTMACNPGFYPSDVTEKLYEINSTGLESEALAEGICIYPNPVRNKLYITKNNGSNLNIDIIDITGKTLIKENLEKVSSLDVSSLNPGIYAVKIRSKSQVKTLRIIKSE